MQLDPEYLRQHYASLSDQALLAVDRADLVEMAQVIFDLEVGRRKPVPPRDTRHGQPTIPRQGDPLDEEADDEEADDDEAEVDEAEVDGETHGAGEEPGWLEEAAEVYSYAVQSATAHAPDAVNARDALEAAGIPCYLDLCEIPREESLSPYGTHRWRLMVPGKLNLRATSVLEREIFNVEFEAGWKTHLEALSDEELRAMNPQVAFGGLYDRVARVNRVYEEEIARRQMK
ncbi:MAG TPA: hypothetical protein VNY05_40330 [Candidatus Acidoferrales bacterium]|jgi:hypothetical protein|nr:hypothetical protein [Candidatus Acidoferrales bacterium]